VDRFRGLYAITDRALLGDRLLPAVADALAGGVVMVQYRDKSADHLRRLDEALRLQQLCRSFCVPLIINDDIDLAASVAADGVHLGSEDGQIVDARRHLGPQAIIGVSCYNQLALGEAAIAAGATYLAFGSFYASTIKPAAVNADLALLQQARQRFSAPLVAIGGITRQNARPLIAAGADMVAVISDLFAAVDIQQAAHDFSALFSDN
jgi:thiamine-phosphate pyrophosphorylase